MVSSGWKRDLAIRDEKSYRRAAFIEQQAKRYETYWRSELDRYTELARMYWHVNFGQWPQEVVDKLRKQGRRPPTFPLIPDKIETLVGVFLSNDFDIQYTPHNGKLTNQLLDLQDMYYDDKENGDWEQSEVMCVLDSHIMVGYERLYVDDQADEFGVLAWENLDARHVLPSPSWKVEDTDKLEDYMVFDDLTAYQIAGKYPKAGEKIRDAALREQIEGIDYGEYEGATPRYRTYDEKWNALHRVWEFHWTERVERTWEYDLKNHCFFPETNEKQGSEEDRRLKLQYAKMMGLSQRHVTYMKQKRRIKRIEAIVPGLDRELFLVAGKDIIQTNSVNLRPLGIRYKGQYDSICNRLWDIQVGVNKGEMNIQDVQARSAKGAFLLDKALSGGDPELEERIEQAWNDPAAREWVDEGVTERLGSRGGIIELPSHPPSQAQFAQTDRYYEMGDRFSKIPAAQDSRTESSKESGRLFRYKLETALVGQKYLLKRYEWHKKKKAKDYALQTKITYAGHPRTFMRRNGKENFTINETYRDEYTGEEVVENDIRLIPLMKIKAVPVRNSFNVRQQTREQLEPYLEILNNPEDALMRTIVLESIVETTEIPEEKREEFKKAAFMAKLSAATAMAVNIQGNLSKIGNQQGALQAMMGEGMGMLPAPNEAPPMPGGGEQTAIQGTPEQFEEQEVTTAETI